MRRFAMATGMLLLVSGTGFAAPVSSPAEPALGTWRGSAALADSNLELSVRIVRTKSSFRATISSPELLLLDQPLDDVKLAGRNVRFTVSEDRPVRFEGVLEGDSIRGTATVPAVPGIGWAHRPGRTMSFSLGRAKASPAPPYAMREVQVASGAVRLAATLFLPTGSARKAGVVLLQSATSKRRADLAYYADHFARAGLAVLLFDKRGTGGSTGDNAVATYEHFADDAAAAVAFLRARPEVDAARVGVWGLGQGALLAAMVGARVPEIRFLVVVSAPGLPPGENAAHCDSSRLAVKGFDAAEIGRTVSLDRRLLAWLRDGRDRAELEALLNEASNTPWHRETTLPSRLPAGDVPASWYWRGRTLDPSLAWRAVKSPVLALYGAADEMLPAKVNSKAVERALRSGGNEDVTARTYASANHLIRATPRGPRGTWDWPRAVPEYMPTVTAWILERVR